jgi:hypothetical protein
MLWDMARQNYILHAWNTLHDAGILQYNNASSLLSRRNATRMKKERKGTEEVMRAIDQFVLSQHRSMKLLLQGAAGGGGVISFMETNIFAALEKSDDAVLVVEKNLTNSSLELRGEQRRRRRLLVSNSSLTSQKTRKLLVQEDPDRAIREYSSILTMTKGYSRNDIGKNALTDSWLQGPLRWPPRYFYVLCYAFLSPCFPPK